MQSGKNRGMTLVEVLVVLAITGIIVGVVYQIFITAQYGFMKSKIDENLLQNIRVAMDWITRDVRTAETLSIPSSDQINIQNLKEDGSVEDITYSVQSGNVNNSKVLVRSVGTGTPNPITTEGVYVNIFSVSSLTKGSKQVGVNITLELKGFDIKREAIAKSPSGNVKVFILKNVKIYSRKLLLENE